ncbi:MAG TPA: MerR family transcriptional regulator [Cryptosporangiaceae bacterium]|nr:MerR family transcriptional regulator [Cryptosporangiaceae bacterium]
MDNLLAIGTFSRATLLSPKALRDYHEAGLLTPVAVDPHTGYRGYSPTQLGDAAVIRELRALDVPLAEIERVLRARDPAVTRAVLIAHQDRVRDRLAEAERILGTVDDLLADPAALTRLAVRERDEPTQDVVSLHGRVAAADFGLFLGDAYPRLYAFLAERGIAPAGPPGALYPGGAFEPEATSVRAYLPVAAPAGSARDAVRSDPDEIQPARLPAARLAVALHVGPYQSIGPAYAAVGSWLAGHAVATGEDVRETYLVGPGDGVDENAYRTELGWPVGPPRTGG